MTTIEERKKFSEKSKRWYLRNTKKAILKSIQYAKNNPEKRKQYSKKWRDSNPEKHTEQNFNIRFKELNFTYNDYLLLNKKQKGLCAICKKINLNQKKRLSLDHCHKKLIARGLLCYSCNTGIGMLKDNIEVLKAAVKYLKKYEKRRS